MSNHLYRQGHVGYAIARRSRLLLPRWAYTLISWTTQALHSHLSKLLRQLSKDLSRVWPCTHTRGVGLDLHTGATCTGAVHIHELPNIAAKASKFHYAVLAHHHHHHHHHHRQQHQHQQQQQQQQGFPADSHTPAPVSTPNNTHHADERVVLVGRHTQAGGNASH